jgi:multidrug transporter EmrE-like cation transporter
MFENIQKYKWLFIASFFSALTVIFIKQYDKTGNNWLLLVTALSEIGLIYGYIQLLKNGDLLTLFGLVKIISILLVIIPSIVFFGSKLTIKKIIGIILAMISIYLLN